MGVCWGPGCPGPVWLSFQVFDLQYDFSGDDAFLVEHGVGKCGFGDGADFSGDTE